MTDISIVVPVYNNEKTLIQLCNEVNQVLKDSGLIHEIMFVNDASPDNSKMVMDVLSKERTEVRYISMKKNVGQHVAILKGLEAACGKKIIVMDADLQDSPKMIPELAQALTENVNAVYVLRQGNYQPLSRMITSRLFKGVIELITGLPKKAGTFFIIKKQLVPQLKTIKCSYPYITIMVAHKAKNISFLKSKRLHSEGISSYSFKKRLKFATKATICAIQCKYFNN